MKRSITAILFVFIAACTSQSEVEPPVAGSTAEIIEALGGALCPDSEFSCVAIEMPLDHFNSSDERTIDVTFAILPATGESKGAFVTATGGPGTAGIMSADSYTSALDPAIPEQFDIVFFDQRGVGISGGLTCPRAANDLYRADADVATDAGKSLLAEAASTFATECVSEMGDPESLPFLSTAQVVEDLEVLRQTFGFEEFILYGESYGTQLAQTYAAAHGDQLDRLLLDGTVDLTLDGFTFYGVQATAFGQTLQATFNACETDDLCVGDMVDDPGTAYDTLAALLSEGPLTVDFPLADGSSAGRTFSLTDLEIIASGQMYGETDRMLFNRALAARSGRGDLIPLLRLLYPNLGTDPQDESIIEDPSWSDAIYYAVECLDYNFAGDSPQDVVDSFFEAGASYDGRRLGSIFYGDLPCAFWPTRNTDLERPEPLEADGIPTMVLGATADPATPFSNGVSVWSRLANGFLMTQGGGPHVIFGRGNPCPDEDATAFILEGTPPTVSTCEGDVTDPYVPLLPESVDGFEDAEAMLDAVELEINYLPEYLYWDGIEDTAAGCNLGGAVDITATDVGYRFDFADCALAEGLVLTGSGSLDLDTDTFMLDVANGSPDCTYSYERAGAEVNVEDPCPTDPFDA
ncbi:MAG TPA: alpha/beta hydrolase [Acidimicrobiia bacterium]|nr:alpha/beta hydrolase [Acidimicrobiia bacterium]